MSSGEKTNEYGYIEILEDDMKFLKDVNTYNSDYSKKLVMQNFVIQQCVSSQELNDKLEVIMKKLNLKSIESLSQFGILYDTSKNQL